MTQAELVKGLTYLGTAYGKTYTKIECEQHFDFLGEYDYRIFIQAIKSLIKQTKFTPKINELIDECEKQKHITQLKVLGYMESNGYFKTAGEYEKATAWLAMGNVPDWLKAEMNNNYKLMIGQQERLRIGG